jgi:ribose 5-phosphate isomerase B
MNDADIEKIIQAVVDSVNSQPASGSLDLTPNTELPNIPLNEKDDVKHVAIGADHHGLDAKNILKVYLESLGYHMVDVGTDSSDNSDYPDFAEAVAKKVASGECERGIMIDQDGIGSSIACNKVRGIRAALCYDMRTIVNSREHANANVLTLGGSFHNNGELCEMTKLWLELRFPNGEHWAKLNKIKSIER